MAKRLQEGRQTAFLIKKPTTSTYVPMGCLTDYEFNEKGKTVAKVSCRDGSFSAPAGDKDLATVSLSGINRVFTAGDVATNVSKDEIQTYTKDGTVLDIKCGGTLVDDILHTGKGFFTDFSDKNPNDANGTFSVTFNFTEEYTSAAVVAP